MFALALDAAFQTFGVDAQYRAAGTGDPVACRVVRDSADAVDALGRSTIVAGQAILEIRVSEIASVAKGDTFTIGAETLKVVAAPKFSDPDRLVRICVCQ